MQEANVPAEVAAPSAPLVIEAPISSAQSTLPIESTNTVLQIVKEAAAPRPSLTQEINTASEIIMRQQAEAFVIKLNSATPEEQQKLLENPTNKELLLLSNVRKVNELFFDGKNIMQIQEDPAFKDLQIKFTDGDGQQAVVHSIVGVDGDSLIVKYTLPPGTTAQEKTFPIQRQFLEDFLIKAISKDSSVLPEAQRKIVELYFRLSEKTITSESLPKEASAQLIEAAREAGILSTSDVEALINVVLSDKPIPTGTAEKDALQINADNEKLAQKRAKLLKPFEDKGILVTDPQQVAALFSELGINAASLGETQNQAAQEVVRLKLLLETNKKKIGQTITMTVEGKPQAVKLTDEIYKQWEVQMIQVETLSSVCLEAVQVFQKEGPLKDYFDQLNAGTLSPDEGRLVVESFRTGEIAKPPDISTARDEQTRAKLEKLNKLWRKQEILRKSTKGLLIGGGGIIGLLAALGLLAKKEKT